MKKIWVLGTSYMAREYYKVLRDMDTDITVIGRGEVRAKEFMVEFPEAKVIYGDTDTSLLTKRPIADYAIVAVNIENLCQITLKLIDIGIKNILIEKPGAATVEELEQLKVRAEIAGINVYVAYNRRYYASVNKALAIIDEDGGVTSYNFEFTEWGHVIANWEKPANQKENLLHYNSVHVIDMAFFLGGKPKEMCSYHTGRISWHKNGSAYAGAGISVNGALFSYQANWNAPGRWGVEILTAKHRLIFRPLESLQIQQIGSVKIEPCVIEDSMDLKYKPGVYNMTEDFLSEKPSNRLQRIDQNIEEWRIYDKIAGSSEA